MSIESPALPNHPVLLPALRWAARLTSLASIGIMLMIAIGEPGIPTAREWLMLAFFPIGLVVGMAVAWWREMLGGAIALGSMAVFYAVVLALSGKLPPGPYFAIVAAPAAMFLAAGLWSRRSLAR